MPLRTIEESITIQAEPATVFTAYVEQIDQWWPRQGTYRYSFAGPGVEPRHISFEPHLGGRFYERFADGSEYVIGHIVAWEPPRSFSYTWRDPRWPAATTVTVQFVAAGRATTVTVTHQGFGVKGVPDDAEGYRIGLIETLGAFAAWLAAGSTSGAHDE